MVDGNILDKAKAAIPELLSVSNISKVISIDDYYSSGPVVDDVVAAQRVIPLRVLSDIAPDFENVSEDSQIRAMRFRQYYEGLDVEKAESLGKAVVQAAHEINGQEPNDSMYLSTLHELFSEDILTTLSPSEWDRQADTLLGSGIRGKVLLLFDQDLANAGARYDEGIAYISSMLSGEYSSKVVCGLLTHTVTEEGQQQAWEEFATKYGLNKDKFIVIAKRWLDPNPLGFTNMLKLLTISPFFTSMKAKVKEILEAATSTAADEINKISVVDFDHIIFKVPQQEGMWEPDMLFRLHSLFHRSEARKLAYEDPELVEMANTLRKVSHLPEDSDLLPLSNAWEIQRREIFEQGGYINRLHLPIELGDIFEVTAGGGAVRQYILLAQPCDLAIRSSGVRSPEQDRFPLVKIAKANGELDQYSAPLQYFTTSPDDNYAVKLKYPQYVRSTILDLCSFTKTGEASIDIGSMAPEGMIPSLEKRYSIVSNNLKKEVNKYSVLWPNDADNGNRKNIKSEIFKKIGPLLLQGDLFKANFALGENMSLTFNCKRIARLNRKHAYALLMSFAACLGRAALDRDFGHPTNQ
ncbi:hypothetical protein [Pseudodesulfovibrio indicus]|uniref:Uncharacterized protein n=1 Tax=Pseudodesulfovibrio indicus TaxID=1716143 RepID=A0AA94PRH7_9BACT|nr:hypothetical protein [Pseudodesulfovibrio indicus]TDT91015.1 hypothetical protein EDC59_102450 [Pseudodesulfovibrio indicus]